MSAISARRCAAPSKNITALLAAEGATWHDIVRTTCYMRDIDRDYVAFNEERTAFFRQQGLIRCRRRPEFKRSCAVLSCWSRLKRLRCSGVRTH